MHTPSRLQRAADVPSLTRVRAWRTHADILRDSAEAPALTAGQRTALLRDAAAAERHARPPGRRHRGHRCGQRTGRRDEERVIRCLAILMRLCAAQIPLASARRGNTLSSCDAVLPPRRTFPP